MEVEKPKTAEEFLAHYGILGMKWGVRRTPEQLGHKPSKSDSGPSKREIKRSVKKQAKLGAKADAQLYKKVTSKSSRKKMERVLAQRVNDSLLKKVQDPKMQSRLRANPSELLDVRYETIREEVMRFAHEDLKPPNTTGKWEVRVGYEEMMDGSGRFTWGIGPASDVIDVKSGGRVKHDSTEEFVFNGTVDINAEGEVTSVKITALSGDAIEQSDSELDDFLAHYGILGMKWGVRRDRKELARARGESVPVRDLQGKKIIERDGKYQRKDGATRSVDAVRARTSQTKARAYGTDSLSNEDIQQLIERLDLEKKYSQITGPKKASNAKKAKKIIADFAGDNAKYAANTLAKREINKLLTLGTKK